MSSGVIRDAVIPGLFAAELIYAAVSELVNMVRVEDDGGSWRRVARGA